MLRTNTRTTMRQIIGFVVFIFATALVQAQALTDAEIQKWAKSYEALMNWSRTAQLEKDFLANSGTGKDGNMFGNMMGHLKSTKHYSEVSSLLSKNGYSDPQQWASTSDRIMTAYVASVVAGKEDQMKAQLQQVEAMMNSGMMPPEQKPMMETMLAQTKATLKAAEAAPAEDKAAVARNREFLETMFKREAKAMQPQEQGAPMSPHTPHAPPAPVVK